MVGDAETFLSWNKDEIFKGLIAIEGHLRNVKPEFKSQDLSCILKHASEIEGHADEAISHSAQLGKDDLSAKFRELRDRIRDYRRTLQQTNFPVEENIRQIREIRRFFESFNPEYDISQCKACGNIEEILSKLKIPKTSPAELEEETAHRVLEYLSQKYNVPKPKLTLLDKCPTEPTQFGLFQTVKGTPEIVLCRGSADIHKTVHEFAHYLQFLSGKPLNEQEAEALALKEMEKPLYTEASHIRVSGGFSMALTWLETGLIVGGQHIGVGLRKVFEWVDSAVGKAGAPVVERPSTWINIAGGLALILYPRFSKRVSPTIDMLMTVIGGYMTTKIWDYIGEAAPAAARLFVPAPAVTPPPLPPTPPAPAPALGVKYQVTA